jgi:hypothetical protein
VHDSSVGSVLTYSVGDLGLIPIEVFLPNHYIYNGLRAMKFHLFFKSLHLYT